MILRIRIAKKKVRRGEKRNRMEMEFTVDTATCNNNITLSTSRIYMKKLSFIKVNGGGFSFTI